MTQAEHILRLLQQRGPMGLTALEILEECGSFRAAARIEELRKAGHEIETRTEKIPSGKRIARYILHPPDTLFDAPGPSTAHYMQEAA